MPDELLDDAEKVMTQLAKIDRGVSVCFRPEFPAGDVRRWYLYLPHLFSGSELDREYGPLVSGFERFYAEKAVVNGWCCLCSMFRDSKHALLVRVTCPRDVSVPGNTPQAWIRWNCDKNNWEDVVPTEKALRVHNIPEGRVVPYLDHRIQTSW